MTIILELGNCLHLYSSLKFRDAAPLRNFRVKEISQFPDSKIPRFYKGFSWFTTTLLSNTILRGIPPVSPFALINCNNIPVAFSAC
jgi:hypothetical protein